MPDTILYLRTSPVEQSHTGANIHIDPAKVSGLQGIFGTELRFPYDISEPGYQTHFLKPVSLEGEIYWIGENDQSAAALPIPSQIVWPHRNIIVPVTLTHIEAIENARSGEAVNINITLRAMTAEPGVVLQSSSPGPVRIERERWLLILEWLGKGTRRLVELPEPQLRRDVLEWHECHRLLDRATRAYRLGDYEITMDACREIVEGIPKVLVTVWGIPEKPGDKGYEKWIMALEGRLGKAWPNDPLTPGMLTTLLNGAWKWLAPGPHYGTGIPQREEAVFALGLCTDLLHFAAQALQAHPDAIAPATSS
jgi:hypothetical protein